MANEEWGTIAAIIYFSLYALLLIALTIFAHINEEHDSKRSFFKAIWNKRGIYGQVLVHLYDTATDIGVLIQWAILAEQESTGENIKSLDMNGLFWTSIAFLILYRVLSIFIAWISAYLLDDECCSCICWGDVCLALIDMYVIKAVYKAVKGDAQQATPRQKTIQLTEAIFESLPQVVLQSVFLIRWHNHKSDDDDDQTTMYLVGMSLFASLFSISNKYSWVDRDACAYDEAEDMGCSKECPIVNTDYVLRIVWRYSYVTARFAMISLIWSVLGGAFLGIFLPCSYLIWAILISFGVYREIGSIWGTALVSMAYGMVCLVATPASSMKLYAIVHVCEMLITMSIITWFAFDDSMDCHGICADPERRQARNNPYILWFIIVGWISMGIDFFTYLIILIKELFDNELGSLFIMYADGMEKGADDI
eukprot:37323_1